MKFSTLGLIALSLGVNTSCAQNATQTSSARAAYGTPAPFRSHVKKNEKAKKRAAKKKKKSTGKERPYQTLPM